MKSTNKRVSMSLVFQILKWKLIKTKILIVFMKQTDWVVTRTKTKILN